MYSFATFRNDSFVGVWGLFLGQWLPTFLLGIAALFARKALLWKRVFPVWLGVAPQLFFPIYIYVFGLSPFYALATVGINWAIFGWIVYSLGDSDSAEFSSDKSFLSGFEKIHRVNN